MTSYAPRLLSIFVAVVLWSAVTMAQSQGSASSANSSQAEGWESDGYLIHQSIELGYRVSDLTGSEQMYDTLVNLRTGSRLLDQSLSIQSQTNIGPLFDNLFISSFGWGGDPNNVLDARVDKNQRYDFRASFRRDQSDIDYNLLVNPLNPPTSRPSVPVTFSPHYFGTRRRMSDFDLTLLPQSKVDLRLGYSRNNMTGPSYSSVHEGTDALLFQAWNTTLNSYRIGTDATILSRTVISYDQFLDYYKGDTNWQLASFASAQVPSPPATIPSTVELGLPIDSANKNPCAVTPPATSLINSTGTLTNISCNAYYNYARTDPIRTSMPTERVRLRTSYFQRWDLRGSYAYSSAEMNAPLNELFNGLISRSAIRQESVTGPAHATRVSNVADFSATLHLTDHLRLVDTLRFWAFRIPQSFTSSETDWTCPDSITCTLLVPISRTVPSVTNTVNTMSFNQTVLVNQASLVWDGSKYFGGTIAFRYGDQNFFHINDFATGDEDRIIVHGYTALAGLWAKPVKNLRVNFDWEHTNNDNAIVRIGPRKQAHYRVQGNYTPRSWASLGAAINSWEASNGNSLIDFHGYSRNYAFTANLNPRERFGVDFAYNLNQYQQNAFICFNDSNTSLSVVSNAGTCTANGYNDPANPLLTYGYYSSNTSFGMGQLMLKPDRRISIDLGYSITSVDGQTPQFSSLQPSGSLQYNYHQPVASLAVDLGHNLTWKGGWNYYQYGEKSFVGPTDPRYFHANNATFSLRWAF